NRIVTLTYADTSTETFTYGTGTNANLVVATTDRNTNQTTFGYDSCGRRTSTVIAASTAVAVTETCTFLPGTTLEATCLRAGDLTTYDFDYRNRAIATSRQANGNTTLTSAVEFDVLGRRLSTTDAYGRRSFFVYDVNDRLVRQVHELIPGTLGTLASPNTAPSGGFAGTGSAGTAYLTSARDEAVMAFTRILTANPAYVIEETTTDALGRTLTRKDGRNIQSTFTYDNLDRMLTQVEDAGGLAATTTMVYDAQSNRTSVTSPRSVVTAMTYTNRNLPKQITEASGTGEATVVSTTTYTLTKKPATTTDALSRVTNYVYGVCCDRLITITDPAGFTTNFTYDYVGNRLTVTDGNALTTVTTFDARNRTATVTNAASETTSIVYDDSLNDGVGLDATGSPLLAFLSGLGIASGSDFSAVKVTNPAGNVTYTVTDGVGRTVRSVDPLLHATTMAYDTVLVSGVGTGLVETTQTDALSHVTRSRTDGAGRTRQGVDALGYVSTATFDAAGNQLSQLDANAIGWSAVYDGRNRTTSRSSTRTDVAESTSWTYDADNNRLTETDGLGKTETSTYDLRNRRTVLLDRVNGTTRFAYDAVSNLLEISDAENEARGGLAYVAGATQYAYDVRNQLTAEAFPAGQTGRTLRTYTYDGGRRLVTRQVGTLSGTFSSTPAFSGTPELTGYIEDQETGQLHSHGRNYLPTLGRFAIRDTYMSQGDFLNAMPRRIFSIGYKSETSRVIQVSWNPANPGAKIQLNSGEGVIVLSASLIASQYWGPRGGDGYPNGFNQYAAYFVPLATDPSGMLVCCRGSFELDIPFVGIEIPKMERTFWAPGCSCPPPSVQLSSYKCTLGFDPEKRGWVMIPGALPPVDDPFDPMPPSRYPPTSTLIDGGYTGKDWWVHGGVGLPGNKLGGYIQAGISF
ncbi:MAG: hypothetical protein AAB263_00835, partial [Planctomycetota bacterium]